MKTIIFIKAVFLLSMILPFQAQSQTEPDSQYVEYMQLALNKLDSAKTVEEVLQAGNLFELISKNYTSVWLPAYYVAYCDINCVFYDSKSSQNQKILEKAGNTIEKLYTFSNADLSEINTLKAYRLTAMIVLNPQENGQKYTSEIIQLYETAIIQNPENPRPIILLADFERRLPPFIRTNKRNPVEEKAKAALLFEKEKPNTDKPYWGSFFLNIL